MNFARYGGRRFLMCMGCAIACTALLMLGFISDITFRDIIMGTVAVYVAGGTAQKFSTTGIKNDRDSDEDNKA